MGPGNDVGEKLPGLRGTRGMQTDGKPGELQRLCRPVVPDLVAH